MVVQMLPTDVSDVDGCHWGLEQLLSSKGIQESPCKAEGKLVVGEEEGTRATLMLNPLDSHLSYTQINPGHNPLESSSTPRIPIERNRSTEE